MTLILPNSLILTLTSRSCAEHQLDPVRVPVSLPALEPVDVVDEVPVLVDGRPYELGVPCVQERNVDSEMFPIPYASITSLWSISSVWFIKSESEEMMSSFFARS